MRAGAATEGCQSLRRWSSSPAAAAPSSDASPLQPLVWSDTRTSTPALASILTSESTLKRPILPLVRSLILGCVTPRACAAADWVRPNSSSRCSSAFIKFERRSRLALSPASNPRSANTLGPPIWKLPCPAPSRPSAARDDFAVPLRADFEIGLRGTPRFFLERVEDINPFLESRDVKHPECAGGANTNLVYTGANHWHRLEIFGTASFLKAVQFPPSALPRGRGEPPEVRQG